MLKRTMSSKITKRTGNRITLELELDLSEYSMLDSEASIAKVLNDAGLLLSEASLLKFDTDGSPLEVGGKKYTSRGQEKKI